MNKKNGYIRSMLLRAAVSLISVLSVLFVLSVLPVVSVLEAEIVVKQDKDGKIVVSNNLTAHNPYSKTDPVRFEKPKTVSSVVPAHYLTKIKKLAKKYDVKEALIVAVARAESSFNPFAVSPKGAVGIMQLMPDTAKKYGVYNRYNAEQNLEAGVRHLKYLHDKYKNLTLTLAAYNAGEEAVKKYGGVPPYKETRGYIKRVMKFMGLSYNQYFKPQSRQIIYKITTPDGRIIITDSMPSNVDGKISVIN